MTATYEKIATNTLGTTTASVTFSSISGSYTDLVLIFNGGVNTSNGGLRMELNSDTGSNYSQTSLAGDGTSAASSRNSNVTQARISSDFGMVNNLNYNSITSLNNYSNSTTYKTWLSRNNLASAGTEAVIGLWRNTAAITSIKLVPSANSFASGSTFTLYGIKAE
jgi:hypothetical protein